VSIFTKNKQLKESRINLFFKRKSDPDYFWKLRNKAIKTKNKFLKNFYSIRYSKLMEYNNCSIPLTAKFYDKPTFPHGLHGIFVSAIAIVGKNCVIFQQVTIGSNTLKDSRKIGSPIIGDNVYIGAGAKIIGKIKIGSNARIGANAVVVSDVDDNSTIVNSEARIIKHNKPKDNTFYTVDKIKDIIKTSNVPETYKIISREEKDKFKKAVRLLFAGDLILLEDGVKNAFNGSVYDFSSVFEYASKYIKESDLAIGTFEGTCAGEAAGYSTSNFNDGIPIALNFPDSFAEAVKNAGFNFVTLANNHLLDKGTDGVLRTLDVLDKVRLGHIGAYRNQDEKNKVSIFEIKGLKIAFLAYTYGVNKTNYLTESNSYISSFLASPNGSKFNAAKEEVIKDFERVKAENPDIIIVLPHMGADFKKYTNNYQETWYKVFAEAGANIVLCNHSHAVQPIEWRDGMLIVNCVGNFTNSYVKHDGDASALAEIYIDKSDKKAFGISVIPLYAQAPLENTYRALPVYDILMDPDLKAQIGEYEFERVKQVQEITTEMLLGHKLSTHLAAPRYYKTENGFLQDTIPPCTYMENFQSSPIVQLLNGCNKGGKVCFVGDSITAGSRNGGIGWYYPLIAHLNDIIFLQKAWDSGTVKSLLDNVEEIRDVNADIYIFGIGTNDVRYRNAKICAITAEEYIEKITLLTEKISEKNSNIKYVFIAPWLGLSKDPNKAKDLSIADRDELLEDYSNALKEFCLRKGYLYLNPNPHIRKVFMQEPASKYLVDHIHPNRLNGVNLYSEAVIAAGGYFSRRGSSKREMPPEVLARLFQQRTQTRLIRFDEQILTNASTGDLDRRLWERFRTPLSPVDDNEFLEKLKFISLNEDGELFPTVGGILMASESPEKHISSAYIQALCYNGYDRNSPQLDAADITGPLDIQIKDACKFVKRNMRTRAIKDPGRIETPQFSLNAVFEAIVNAAAHRDYSIYGSKIRLIIYLDRLELYSPGTIPNTMTIESLSLRPSSRNELLSSLLARCPMNFDATGSKRIFIMDKKGEGVPIILSESMELSGKKPEYKLIDDAELLLTIYAA